MQKELEELIEEIKHWGCSCDIMNGYSCGHIAIENKIKSFIEKYCK